MIWEALNAENRVSLAVKAIDTATGSSEIFTFNQYEGTGK